MVKVVVAAVLVLLATRHASAEMTLIRTFVNGVAAAEGTVKDLHIEYSQPLDSYTVVSGGGTAAVGTNPKHLNVNFTDAVAPGGSVSIRAHTTAGSLAIEKFWWTDAEHNPITRSVTYVNKGKEKTGEITEYGPWMRGDEARLPFPLPTDTDDPYAILNKRHHWGGEDRKKREVCIELDIQSILHDPPTGITADALPTDIRAAAKQWATCTKRSQHNTVPRAGPDNPNHGNNSRWIDPPVMAPGPSHGDAKGQTFRSVTGRECAAALLKYPCGLRIEIISAAGDKGCAAPATGDAECEGGRQPTSAGRIPVEWGGTPGKAIGYGPSSPKSDDANATGEGSIHMDKTPKDKTWSMASDTNGDGWITNTDGPIGAQTYDFYSAFKHELGHVLCFSHSGSPYFLDEHAHLTTPSTIDVPGSAVSVYGTAAADPSANEHESILFAATMEGGLGGLDIWRATPVQGTWELENLGPQINSPRDDSDPFLASDGTTLMFTSNRGGTEHALFEAVYDLRTKSWRQATPLAFSHEHPGSERHPALTGDMRTLYFASDGPGGAGGSDIWASEWIVELGWSQPFWLGDTINTAADEIDPSISGDGRALYFASDRPGGAGGYDLWRSERTSDWQSAAAVAIANTSADERAPSLRLDGEMLYFTRGTNDASRHILVAARADAPAPSPSTEGTPSSKPPPASRSAGARHWRWIALGTALALLIVFMIVRRRGRQ